MVLSKGQPKYIVFIKAMAVTTLMAFPYKCCVSDSIVKIRYILFVIAFSKSSKHND